MHNPWVMRKGRLLLPLLAVAVPVISAACGGGPLQEPISDSQYDDPDDPGGGGPPLVPTSTPDSGFDAARDAMTAHDASDGAVTKDTGVDAPIDTGSTPDAAADTGADAGSADADTDATTDTDAMTDAATDA